MQPHSAADVATFVGGDVVQGRPEAMLVEVTTDSRRAAPGQLFVPLRGARFDGHDFIEDALGAGAAGVFVERRRRDLLPMIRQRAPEAAVIVVRDGLDALQRLAAAVRRRLPRVHGRVVGVTGSVGKTTTKDMLAAVLGMRWRTTSTEGNLNNEIGLPLTLLRADGATEALVLEMGMRGLGEIRQLSRIAAPDVGVVTNVGEVHLGPLGSVERIALAKRELVEQLSTDGVAVLNGDDGRVRSMAAAARGRTVTFGLGDDNDVRAEDIVSKGEQGVAFVLHGDGVRQPVELPVPGRHNVYNALAAAAVGFVLGMDGAEVAEGFARSAAFRSAMRLQFQERDDGLLVIDDAYNAGPASMAAALDVLGEMSRERRRVAVLGDMLELGDGAVQAHRDVGRRVAEVGVDVFVAVGEYGREMADAAVAAGVGRDAVFVCSDASDAAAMAASIAAPGDVVLVKASRGVALERVVQRLMPDVGDEKQEGEGAPS